MCQGVEGEQGVHLRVGRGGLWQPYPGPQPQLPEAKEASVFTPGSTGSQPLLSHIPGHGDLSEGY